MKDVTDRRQFLQACGGMMLGTTLSGLSSARAAEPASRPASGGKIKLKKAVSYSMLPDSLKTAERFQLAADIGFDGVEVTTLDDDAAVDSMKAAAEKSGVRVHSIMHAGNWGHSLTSHDPAIARKGMEILRRSLHNAHVFGADTVLLVPGVVTPEVRYKDAWTRSQQQIREILPLARELKVIIALENVGNRFLLSPLEFAKYVDEYADPWLQAYFDIGNSLPLWSYPQDWILTLGARIKKLHLKDYDLEKKRWAKLGEGDVDFAAVCRALTEIGYHGFVTAELEGGDEAYLRDVSRRMDKVFSTL